MQTRASTADPIPFPADEAARTAWFPRAIISGFAASVTMLFAYLVAFAVAVFFSTVQWNTLRGGIELGLAFHNLINNSVVDLARSNLYVALAVYITGGLVWAVLYARFFEPRLTGPDWLRGIVFALVPFFVSVLIVLPLVGGGFLGLGLGAGPLPLLGNLILHVVFGAVLGVTYGPFGDTIQATDGEMVERLTEQRAARGSERSTARWLIGGWIVGLVLGTVVAAATPLAGAEGLFGHTSLAFIVSTMLIAGACGALMGSFAGLTEGTARR